MQLGVCSILCSFVNVIISIYSSYPKSRSKLSTLQFFIITEKTYSKFKYSNFLSVAFSNTFYGWKLIQKKIQSVIISALCLWLCRQDCEMHCHFSIDTERSYNLIWSTYNVELKCCFARQCMWKWKFLIFCDICGNWTKIKSKILLRHANFGRLNECLSLPGNTGQA